MKDSLELLVISPSVRLLLGSRKLQIDKAFAERNLSSVALKFGKKENGTYLFDWGTTSYIVAFELPLLFQFNFGEVEHFLSNYCMTYINDSNLNLDSLYFSYIENYNRVRVEKF